MKTLKDPGQVLEIMRAKLDELHKRYIEADGKEATEIGGQEAAIIRIARHIRHVIEDHGCFGADDIAWVYYYAGDAEGEANKYHRNPRDIWFMKGRAEGAAWALKEIEKRMEEEP